MNVRHRKVLSHLKDHKLRQSFRDSLVSFCSCGRDIKTQSLFSSLSNNRCTRRTSLKRESLLIKVMLFNKITPRFSKRNLIQDWLSFNTISRRNYLNQSLRTFNWFNVTCIEIFKITGASVHFSLSFCPAENYLLKVNNVNTRAMCEISSRFTVKTPEWRQWCFLVPLLLTLNRFHALFWRFYCWRSTSKCKLGMHIHYLWFCLKYYVLADIILQLIIISGTCKASFTVRPHYYICKTL